MTLRQWLLDYPLDTKNQSAAQWEKEWDRFKKALRKFWKAQGIEVQW